ncbi:hypothetical protein BMETH_1086_1 [methanotrophic bacterial endosymbiont of Bathymodiolus sp.]|nr:hypothetical protein BMETH_1086_1 [methanotrophic bacterial endosymbiont of Bathymodiolus sp.]
MLKKNLIFLVRYMEKSLAGLEIGIQRIFSTQWLLKVQQRQ